MYVLCGWKNIREKLIVTLLLISFLTFTCDNAFAWGSLNTTTQILGISLTAPSHQYILTEAYKNLENDSAFGDSGFPSLKKIMEWEGQDLTRTYGTSGKGPDAPEAKTKYSWHEYNPPTGKGEAPTQAANFYQKLKLNLSLGDTEETPEKDAAYLAHYIADVSCPYHVNGMPADDAGDTDVRLQDDQVGYCLKWTGKGMGRSEILTDAEIKRYQDTLSVLDAQYYMNFPMGAPIRGSGGKDKDGTPCKNWTRELNNWSNIYKGNLDADWFDPWYSDGFMVIATRVSTDTLTEQSSTHTWWEWYAFNRYSRPTYPATKVGYSDDFLKIQKDKGNGDRSNIAEFAKKIASNTRNNQKAILDESTTEDTQRDNNSALGKAYREAITDVYTAWRASFSALRPDLEVGDNTGLNSKKLRVKIKNNAPKTETGDNTAKDIKIDIKMSSKGCIQLSNNGKDYPKEIKSGEEIVIDDVWELKSDKNCTEKAEFQIFVTGKFAGIPDSGKALVKKILPIEVEETPQDCGNVDYSKLTKYDYGSSVIYEDSKGLQQGPYVLYFDDAAKRIREKGCYLDDNKTGHWTTWLENGNKSSEGDYKDYKPTGHWTTWRENGNKDSEGDYKDGKRTGHWTKWFENGNKYDEGDYNGYNKTGHWTHWYEDGTKWKEGDYKDNKETGHWTIWRGNGNKVFKWKEGDYKDGKQTGHWTRWDEDGGVIEEKDY
jgi:antitoxin component YwqK of YwqJK toxin-antitoxin module